MGKGSDGEMGMLVPLSSTDPNNIDQIWKITCYVQLCEMCVHLCTCKFDGLILW